MARSFTAPTAPAARPPRTFQFAGAANVPRDGNGRWTKGGGGGVVKDGGGSPGSKPAGGGKYLEGSFGGTVETAGLEPKPGTLFSGSTRLQGKTTQRMDAARSDHQGLTQPGHIVLESRNGGRVYAKPTGKIVASNSTRPGLVEFDTFEVGTGVKDGVIVGEIGPHNGKVYALAEQFNLPSHIKRG